MSQFSEIITGFMVYEDDVHYYGLADVTLPNITQITEEMEGAGVAGKYTSTVMGHIEAMKSTINFRNATENAVKLFRPTEHHLELRANVQERDSVKGAVDLGVKHVLIASPINLDMGKLGNYVKGDSSAEFAVRYYAMYLNGKKKIEVDPFNYIFNVDGVDYLTDIRKNLGMA